MAKKSKLIMRTRNVLSWPMVLMSLACAWRLSSSAQSADLIIDRVRFLPAGKGGEKELVGGIFSGSNVSRTDGFEDLAVIKTPPELGQWGELPMENQKVYRWLRFTGSPGSNVRIGKIEFMAGQKVVAGTGKGLPYSHFIKIAPRSADPARQTTELDAIDTRFMGFDLQDAATAPRPTFDPVRHDLPGPAEVSLSSSPGAVIRYTLDGTWPTADHGATYSAPIRLAQTTTLEAAALWENHAPSIPAATTYCIGAPPQTGLSSVHVGNSLTGTTSGFGRYARTAGYDHQYLSFLRAGALTKELWALASGEISSDPHASAREETATKRGSANWQAFWNKVGKVDLLTVQPRDFHVAEEAAADIQFFNLFRQKSPDLQPWLYCEWTELNRKRPTDKGEVPSRQMPRTFPALSWEESMGAMLLYVEDLQQTICETYHEGKRPRVLPAALAMGWIRNKIDHGKVPGIAPGSFYPLLFADSVHPAAGAANGSANGAYLVDMTWFSAFYRESPEGKVLPIETTFTLEQSAMIQRLAWDVIKNYPDCGLYEPGDQPCTKPEIVNDGKTITLTSATPGAWFRYTLDGTIPSRTRGYVYCGVISVQPEIQVKAIAYQSGMADSEVAELRP